MSTDNPMTGGEVHSRELHGNFPVGNRGKPRGWGNRACGIPAGREIDSEGNCGRGKRMQRETNPR